MLEELPLGGKEGNKTMFCRYLDYLRLCGNASVWNLSSGSKQCAEIQMYRFLNVCNVEMDVNTEIYVTNQGNSASSVAKKHARVTQCSITKKTPQFKQAKTKQISRSFIARKLHNQKNSNSLQVCSVCSGRMRYTVQINSSKDQEVWVKDKHH